MFKHHFFAMIRTTTFVRSLFLVLPIAAALASAPTTQAQPAPVGTEAAAEPIILREGDELQITFPGAPSLNTQQRIRSDGRITLDLIGEVSPVGMTPLRFQERLVELFATQLVSKEVTVRLVSRSFFVYMNGSVGSNGRLEFDRPVTLLEAVMAAGFADGTVRLDKVRLMRMEGGKVRSWVIDLNRVMDGKSDENPALKQGDMIIVPGRIL